MKILKLSFLPLLFLSAFCFSQEEVEDQEAFFIKSIYEHSLMEGSCYDWLSYLSTNIGGRLSGSKNAALSVEYTADIIKKAGADKVWKQECMVPRWIRGDQEVVKIINSKSIGTKSLNCTALGNSEGSGIDGVQAEVIEVQSLEEVEELGAAGVKGKIVFYNRPMNNAHLRTFRAYGEAVDQRGRGPRIAAKYGAVGAIVRSMTTKNDDIPHTGFTFFTEEDKKIPAIAISTNDANFLSDLLEKEKVNLFMRNTSYMSTEVPSHNVVGEIKGSEFPEEIIVIGGHLDSWDLAGGAHDDGAGCVHSIQVFETFRALNYKPKRTIRCVMFMNEENGLSGGKKYAELALEKGETHIAAIESDSGGFTPRGFSADGEAEVINNNFKRVKEWFDLLEPYGLRLTKGGSGADIGPLKPQGPLMFGLRPDSQRYFDFHHTAVDHIDAVNERELKLGAAAMTSLVYLIDQNGVIQ